MKTPESPLTPGMSFSLTEDQIHELQNKSQHGDAEASRTLWLFYNFTARDDMKAMEWLEKAAEQGLPVAQYTLAIYLSNKGNSRYDLSKAKHWATAAANSGEDLAHRLLQDIYILEESGDSV